MKSALKNKTKAMARVPQNREDAIWAIGRIGTLHRAIAARKAAADETIRHAGEKYEEDIADLATELAEHEQGVQTWCEANRNALTQDGKVKYHDFGTGRVNWRAKPPKVSVKGVETAIAACKRLGFELFVRTREELNKEAMLADPDKARLIAGVSISSDGELFEIEPLEIETSTVQ